MEQKSKVAPIKCRYPQQSEPESWRDYLPSVAGVVIVVLFSLAFALPLTYLIMRLGLDY
jgi:hypothetical protein